MALPPLSERELGALVEERDKLRAAHDRLAGLFAVIYGGTIRPLAARALDRINDEIELMTQEINERGAR